MGSVRDLEVYKADSEPDDEDEYAAPTKVGPMSHAAIAQMMRDAEVEARLEAQPSSSSTTSGVRPAIQPKLPGATPAGDGPLPVLDKDEENEENYFEPTVLNERAAEIAAATIDAIRSKETGEDSPKEDTSALADSFDSPAGDSQVKRRSTPIAALPSTSGALAPAGASSLTVDEPADHHPNPLLASSPMISEVTQETSALVSSTKPYAPPKEAAFPEWLGVTLHKDELERRKDKQLVLHLVVAGGVFLVVTAALVWWLF